MDSISKLFATSTLAAVLGLFLLHSDEEFYQSDIAKKTGKALMQVQRSLKTLKEVGLISSSQRGRMVYYRAIKTHPAFADLKNLFTKTLALGDTLRAALLPLLPKIQCAFIFGSVATGNETADSDIDIFILGNVTLRELTKVLRSTGLQRELNPVLFDSRELRKRVAKKDHFFIELLGAPKVWLIGNENDFKQLVKGRKTQGS